MCHSLVSTSQLCAAINPQVVLRDINFVIISPKEISSVICGSLGDLGGRNWALGSSLLETLIYFYEQ